MVYDRIPVNCWSSILSKLRVQGVPEVRRQVHERGRALEGVVQALRVVHERRGPACAFDGYNGDREDFMCNGLKFSCVTV